MGSAEGACIAARWSTPVAGASVGSAVTTDSPPRIEDLALLSDCHVAALVDRSLTVVWMCSPRFDSPSVFGRLLDPEAGHSGIAVAGATETTRRYLTDTLVLQTEVTARTGTLRVVDALAAGPNPSGHDLCAQPPGVLVRRLECVSGTVDIVLDHAPRPEYGRVVPLLERDDGGVRARGGPTRVVLSAPWQVELHQDRAIASATLQAGQVAHIGIEVAALTDPQPPHRDQEELAALLDETVEAWQRWSDQHQAYQGHHRDLVHHSGRVLQALTYRPTHGIVAAPTTSLPEQLGGERNWDYRYTWLRDASWTLSALWHAACPDEAVDFFHYVTWSTAGRAASGRAQIMYGIGGEHDLTERTLSHLSGYDDSRPVRVGNDAWDQDQLDIYGELLDAAHRLRDQLVDATDQAVQFLRQMADIAARRWQEPDQGIWEVRGRPQRFLHSALMCWVALDRAVDLIDVLDPEDGGQWWRAEAEAVREALLSQGWNDELGAFTQTLGGDQLDAAALMVPLVGFLPADDPRVLSTIAAIERDLVDDRGLVRRYHTDTGVDGVAGDEGAFLLCTFWLAQALAQAGEVERARTYFDRAAGSANDVGLLAEEVDAATGRLLGNFPQAFSHVGLIHAARVLDAAQQQQAEEL
jgi:GH15 family glucan-1,4-alpha-glucosidase